jgi:4-hydroxymandelate oxidase
MSDPAHRDASDRRANRRRFVKLLAGSPLLGLACSALSPDWLRAVASERGEHSGVRCTGCGQPMPLSSHAGEASALQAAGQQTSILDAQLSGEIVESVERAVNVWDFERVAHANTLPEHWAYLHMGVDDFETRKANREGFLRLMLRPRRIGLDAAKLDTAVEMFGRRWSSPLFLCPVAALEAYHTEGESGAARAAKARGLLQIQSHQSSQGYEPIAEARGDPQWFQLYANSDWTITKKVLDRVSRAGCPVLVWTVDLLGGSNRELVRRALGADGYKRPLCLSCHNHKEGYQRPMHRGLEGPPGPRPPYTWDYVKRLKDATPMKVILKGIVTREEAELAVEHGADGIMVSNHGGRAENSLRSTIDCLPEVVAGVKGRIPVLLDSGVRRGADMFKAVALGATAVGIGRPYVWGLGAFGQSGVDKVIEMILDEFNMVMRQTRTASIKEIGPQYVMPAPGPVTMRTNQLGFGL